MSFLAPLALAGLLFLPVVVAMYLLKLRRDEAKVPSTLLWQKLVSDVEANAPWQRLRRSLLLLLQLLLVLILAFLAARPFIERPAGLAGDVVLVIDTSASMQATDAAPTRLDAAKAAAIDALRELPGGGQGQRDRGGADGPGHRQRHQRPRQREAGDQRHPAHVRRRRPGRRAAARVGAGGAVRRRGDPGRDRRRARDAAVRDARGAGPRAPGGPRGEERGDRRAGGAHGAQRALALGVHLDRQPGPPDGRAAGPAVRGRRAARLAGPGAGPAAPDRHLHRRHRRPGQPGVGDRGPARGQRRDEHRRAGPAGRGRPRVGHRAACPPADDPARERGRPVPRDRALVPARHRALRRHARQVRPRDQARAVRPGHLRGLPARRAACQADPRDRPARDARRWAP